jgi:hypothetical protein
MIGKNKILLLLVGALLLVAGCSRKAITTTTEVKDSIVTRYVPRLVEVKVPGDTVAIYEYLECDSVTNKPKPFSAKAKSKKAHVAVVIDSTGKLSATGGCDSLKALLKAMDKELFHYRHEKKEEVIPQFKTRKIDVILRWIAITYLLLTVAYILKKLNPRKL